VLGAGLVAGQDERSREALHAVVTMAGVGRSPRAPARPAALAATVARSALMVLVAGSLLAAVAGGLLRAGVSWGGSGGSTWPGHAAAAHSALMMSGFLGTVIAIERAVAIRLRWAFVAPFASGLGGAALLAGHPGWAAGLGVIAAMVFVAANIVVVSRHAAAHTVLLLIGAAAWLAGNLLFATGQGGDVIHPWWFAFLVLTIAAERLEMTRLMRREPVARPSLQATLVALLAGAALSGPAPRLGGSVFGLALAALAVWLLAFDIARRTAFTHGLSRYMAVCLLSGYAWLGVAGVAWTCMSVGLPGRDAALHALGLGFIVSMVMGHAPVILPAVARIKLLFGPWFYAPLVLLHASLALRLGGGLANRDLQSAGAVLNALALALFIATVAGSAITWRARMRKPSLHKATPSSRRD